jgi:tetratricopeptide (TPR) repeat protein
MRRRYAKCAAAAVAALLICAAAEPARGQQEDPAAAAWNAGEHARARELYGTRVAADSTDVQALHRLGLLHAWNRDFATAIPLLERLIRSAPSAAARTDLARVLSWSGRYGEAESQYRQLLADDPNDAEALRGLARVTTWRGDLAGGEVLWRQLVAMNPDDAEAHVGLSQVLRWRGQPRAALTHAEAAVRLRPGDRDALEQLAWAGVPFGTRVAPTFSAETDSDDNRLYTAALTASTHVAPRVALLLNAYLRRAEGPTPFAAGEVSRETRAVSAGARVEAGDGWAVTALGGVVDRPAGSGTTGTWRAAVTSPGRLPVTGTASYARAALDATSDLMARDVVTDELAASLAAQLVPGLRVDGGVAHTRFRGETVNDRLLGRLGLDVRVMPMVHVRPRLTAFRFDETVQEGYFSPDRYVLGEVGLGVDRWGSRWSFSGEVAPGVQQIGSGGDGRGALSGRARVGYTVAPGREVGLGASFSNLGIDGLRPGDAGYRYQALVLSMAWGL